MNKNTSNDREYNHRSIYAHYTLYLKPGVTLESGGKALDAFGKEDDDTITFEGSLSILT
jgi:hypothetical protein